MFFILIAVLTNLLIVLF